MAGRSSAVVVTMRTAIARPAAVVVVLWTTTVVSAGMAILAMTMILDNERRWSG